MIKKLLILGLLILSETAYAYEFPVVRLKSGGDYTNYCKVVAENNYDRIVNFDNVSIIRKFGESSLLIDGHINIKFSKREERERFLTEYILYQQTRSMM